MVMMRRYRMLLVFTLMVTACGPDLTAAEAAEAAEAEVRAYAAREGLDRQILGQAKIVEYERVWTFEYASRSLQPHIIMVIVSKNGRVELTRK